MKRERGKENIVCSAKKKRMASLFLVISIESLI